MRSPRPRRSRPAAASTMASNCDAFSSRVSTLPRSSANVRSGRAAASWARRRTEPVADPRAGRQRCRTSSRPAHRGGRRVRAPRPAARPSGVIAGRSLAECCARSARPSSTASCTSLTNMPLPPISWIGTSARWSPVVLTITSSTSPPSSSATRPACHNANALRASRAQLHGSLRSRLLPPPASEPPLRPVSFVVVGGRLRQIEQLGERVGVELSPSRAGGVLHADRWARATACSRRPG